MNKFSKIISPETVWTPTPSATLGIPRKEMPQVDSAQVQDFLKWSGFKHKTIQKFNPRILKSTQRDFNPEKIFGMMGNEKALVKPIMVSSDNYVVDGHHRWLAAVNKSVDMPIIRIEASIVEILAKIRSYPKVYSKTIGESV